MTQLFEVWWGTGYGTEERYYVIATEKEMESLRLDLVRKYDKVFILPYNPGYRVRTINQMKKEHGFVEQ
jgi:hypothetical protein